MSDYRYEFYLEYDRKRYTVTRHDFGTSDGVRIAVWVYPAALPMAMVLPYAKDYTPERMSFLVRTEAEYEKLKETGMSTMDNLQLEWLYKLKRAEGWPTLAFLDKEEDRIAVGNLQRNGLIERRGYSESGMSTFYYLTEKGNRTLNAV